MVGDGAHAVWVDYGAAALWGDIGEEGDDEEALFGGVEVVNELIVLDLSEICYNGLRWTWRGGGEEMSSQNRHQHASLEVPEEDRVCPRAQHCRDSQ